MHLLSSKPRLIQLGADAKAMHTCPQPFIGCCCSYSTYRQQARVSRQYGKGTFYMPRAIG
jgi:hypothetical protein